MSTVLTTTHTATNGVNGTLKVTSHGERPLDALKSVALIAFYSLQRRRTHAAQP